MNSTTNGSCFEEESSPDQTRNGGSSNPRILLTRLSHIGDCVLTLPLANAIRTHFPKAHLCWAVESPSHQLLESHPAVDQIIKIPKGWLKSPRSILRLRSQLRKEKFDLTIDPQGLSKSSLLGWLSGAKRRIGLARPWAGEVAPFTYTDRVEAKSTHIVLRSLELLGPLGIPVRSAVFNLEPMPEATIRVDRMIDHLHLKAGYAVINPSASWPSKCWDIDRFGAVAKQLGDQLGVSSLIVWAGENEKRMAEQISDNSAGHATVAQATSLPELVAVFHRARLCLSADTGPLHIAAATGVPCIGLYGATKPENCGAFGSHCINLQQAYQEGSRKQRRKADNSAMLKIEVQQVVDACRAKLGYAPLPKKQAA